MLKGVILLFSFLTIVGSTLPFYTVNSENRTADNPTNDNRRVSARKCEEYSRSVVQKVEGSPLDTLTSPGGREAKLGEFPHMVAIGTIEENMFKFFCAGNLISPRFVLLSAHCTKIIFYPEVVSIGTISASENDQNNQVPIVNITKHPDYKSPNRYNDIALLELETDVNITDTVRPACLWLDDDLDGNDRAIVPGWEYSHNGTISGLMKQVFSIHSNKLCNETLFNLQSRNWAGLSDTQMCAEGTENICKIAGSPLDVKSKQNPGVHYILGIISFGPRQCGVSPDVFTRVSKYVDWIESVVWPGE